MTGGGLAEVANPSALFLSERGQPVAGSAVFVGIEGTRPVLTEIQALVAPSAPGSARRTACTASALFSTSAAKLRSSGHMSRSA